MGDSRYSWEIAGTRGSQQMPSGETARCSPVSGIKARRTKMKLHRLDIRHLTRALAGKESTADGGRKAQPWMVSYRPMLCTAVPLRDE